MFSVPSLESSSPSQPVVHSYPAAAPAGQGLQPKGEERVCGQGLDSRFQDGELSREYSYDLAQILIKLVK